MADDELTQQRASDLGDIKTRLIKILLGIEEVDISAVPEGTILVAEDLTPSMTAGINPANVQGVLTEIGGKTSHSCDHLQIYGNSSSLSIETSFLSLMMEMKLFLTDQQEKHSSILKHLL